MSADNHQLQTLRTLIVKSQYESLSESEITQLNTLICSEKGALEAVALIDQLCALTDSGGLDSLPMAEVLSEAFGREATSGTVSRHGESVSPKNVPASLDDANAGLSRERAASSSQPNRWTKAYWWVGLAASHLLIASLAWSLAKPSSNNAPPADLAFDAWPPQLVSMTACVWRTSGDLVPTIGAPIRSGEILNLVEGIAEFRIGESTPGEALVRLEGPASVHIRNDGGLGFLDGSMTVKSLGIGSRNVTVETPIGTVLVDGQSSIGMVLSDAESEVHVFAGRVLVQPIPMAAAAPAIKLAEGEAVRISAKSEEGLTVVKFEASEANFASVRSPGFDPLYLGEEYVHAVLDSQPSVYWRFEGLTGEYPGFVENQGSAPGMHAVVIGNPGWRQYGDNRVAELGSSTSSAFRSLEPWPLKPLDEYTIEMWVKPLLFHHGEVICMHDLEALADGRYPHTMMLEATSHHYFTHRLTDSPPNRFRFVHRALGAAKPISATNLFAGSQYKAREWQHVVAQKKGNQQMLWIDGQLSAERDNPVPLNENVQILIGQVYPDSVYRRFVGQIDEVALYDRCLTPQELRTHIKAAGRSVAPKQAN
ncbi:LamG domain-containing protein [Novipirellula artificiosorum]|uniref:LamG-like jellyroll fold domain-containing protein n=1 Tax=Novipirellula artificiosorum TaxID=2528016 RepID=A0A5C6D935_9BACT|nr:LamG domain-containing protein [Novipirellula artificiosorum]TWU32217.1 hypothetical protein Poly41_57020 [Novipirellula artificiosorum]